MNDVNHEKIENLALSILDSYNITEPVVDVTKIAKDKGIEIKEISMPTGYNEVAGFYDKDQKTIYIEASDKPSRKLFTIAHELGHIFLEHTNYGVLFRIPKKDANYIKEEKEANSFAANLLMPVNMVFDYMEKYNLSHSDYKKMSDIFGVPIVAMKMRLEDHLK
ncbi:MAG TPA: ImmA/IrrE family metallo-endopeptidase [Candidatus Paceibacterota bacterium]|jgi:Zn-dependent peptidase ImmA (M78 family)|nr:ImmA/IrrE family metallo-endopeptidase [Candidatus Paceibacterota bacterium]